MHLESMLDHDDHVLKIISPGSEIADNVIEHPGQLDKLADYFRVLINSFYPSKPVLKSRRSNSISLYHGVPDDNLGPLINAFLHSHPYTSQSEGLPMHLEAIAMAETIFRESRESYMSGRELYDRFVQDHGNPISMSSFTQFSRGLVYGIDRGIPEKVYGSRYMHAGGKYLRVSEEDNMPDLLAAVLNSEKYGRGLYDQAVGNWKDDVPIWYSLDSRSSRIEFVKYVIMLDLIDEDGISSRKYEKLEEDPFVCEHFSLLFYLAYGPTEYQNVVFSHEKYRVKKTEPKYTLPITICISFPEEGVSHSLNAIYVGDEDRDPLDPENWMALEPQAYLIRAKLFPLSDLAVRYSANIWFISYPISKISGDPLDKKEEYLTNDLMLCIPKFGEPYIYRSNFPDIKEINARILI